MTISPVGHAVGARGEPAHSEFCYHVFGLSLSSEIPLPELAPTTARIKPDVVVRLGTFPPQPGEQTGLFTVHGDGAVLNIPGAGRYLVRGGREIVVEPEASGSERHLRLYLLGSAFAAVLHQRDLLPIHSNAIEIRGRAVAFAGPSGSGKSTMAAWFHDRGYNVLADDVCVVTDSSGGMPLAQPGIPRLRLWRDALESSGRSASEHEHAFDDADKYNVPTRAGDGRNPVPLAAMYVLDEPRAGAEAPAIARLSGMDAVHALVANTYRGAYVPLLGGTARHLNQCVELARKVPIFALTRVWGFESMSETAELIERHVQELPVTSRSSELSN